MTVAAMKKQQAKIKTKYTIGGIARVFRDALAELQKNDPLRMAGATAFFTTFALPPILVILIQVLRLFLQPETIRYELNESLSEIVGPESYEQILNVLRSIRQLAQNWFITIGGFIFLLFVATTLFKIIKNSLNQVWKVRAHKKVGLYPRMRTRIKGIMVIMIAGVLFMIGIVAEGVQAFIGKYIFEFSPLLSAYFNTILSQVMTIFIVTIWFALVFRFLPDARPVWKIALTGGFLTSVLFTLGKLILHWLLSYSNINTIYGTSASIVLLLLFVFYSALILYYGAAFTKIWAVYTGSPIHALPHAVHYTLTEEVEEKPG